MIMFCATSLFSSINTGIWYLAKIALTQEEYSSIQELLTIIKNRGADIKTQILDYMQDLEQTALNKTWGVALSPEGKTIRLKKKEFL